MNLLVVSNTCPWPPTFGARMRYAHLIDHLSKAHRVRTVALQAPDPGVAVPPGTEVVPLASLVEPPPPRSRGGRVADLVLGRTPLPFRYLDHPRVRRAFRDLGRLAGEADAVWVALPQFARLALDAGWGKPVVCDYFDVTARMMLAEARRLPRSLYKALAYAEAARTGWFERRLVGRLAAAVVCSEEDRRFFRRHRGRVHVVPNGAAARPLLAAADQEPGRLLFVGVMEYGPNAEGVRWFVRECLPRVGPGAYGRPTLDVVGKNPPPDLTGREDLGVRARGFVPDLDEVYRRAAVVVAPVRLGGGTKLKVLEALAYGKAVVATPEAAFGLGLRPGVDLEVAADPAAFAAAVGGLLADPDRRARLGAAGREQARSRFSWEAIGRQAERVLANL